MGFLGLGLSLNLLNRVIPLVPTGLWVLITGAWDDAGEWDDAATWNDGA